MEHRTDLIICTHSREGNTPSYSRINTVKGSKLKAGNPITLRILSVIGLRVFMGVR